MMNLPSQGFFPVSHCVSSSV